MIGAILGDIIGAPYEFDRGNKTKDFPLFKHSSQFTDDSVMTVAVAEALMDTADKSDEEIRAALVSSIGKTGRAENALPECTAFEVCTVKLAALDLALLPVAFGQLAVGEVTVHKLTAVKACLCKVAIYKAAAVKGDRLKLYPTAIGRGDDFFGIGFPAYFFVAFTGGQ